MADPKTELVRSWFTKSWHDLESARVLSDEFLDTAIFHCQQSAEKGVKGFLVYHDVRVSKTHNVENLLDRASAIVAELKELAAIGKRLTPYAQSFRYPDDEASPTQE